MPVGDYWVSFAVPMALLPQAPDRKLGVDVGITDLAVTSDGWKSGKHEVSKKKAARLRRYQRQMSRRVPGSKRRGAAKRRAARLQRQIANSRHDFLHQSSHHIASTAKTVVLRDPEREGHAHKPQSGQSSQWGLTRGAAPSDRVQSETTRRDRDPGGSLGTQLHALPQMRHANRFLTALGQILDLPGLRLQA
jgi:transposase